jgi:hypothetical protein
MKFVRSVAAVVVGFLVGTLFNAAIQSLNGVLFPDDIVTDPALIREKLPTMPLGPLLVVVIAWETGAFAGGVAAALTAGWARTIHAGMIGAATLVATIKNFVDLPGHPNWMILAGLLLPLPASVLGGWVASPREPPFGTMGDP